MTQNATRPSELVILLSPKYILWPILMSSPILLVLVVNSFSAKALAQNLDPGEIFFAGLIALGVLAYLVDFARGGRSRRYVVIGEKGVYVGGAKPRLIRWREVEDCACESSGKRQVMTILTQGEAPSAGFSVAHALGAAKWMKARPGHFDIDFSRAQTPQRSLDLAMQSCRAWLATLRDARAPT